jgi:hypothetical protein
VTRQQLERFIEIRNSSQFSSNLQFAIDCDSAGFSVDELGPAERLPGGGWCWDTPHGRLVERHNQVELEDPTDAN